MSSRGYVFFLAQRAAITLLALLIAPGAGVAEEGNGPSTKFDISRSSGRGTVEITDLAFVIDVSGSVDATEYTLQLEGFARAIDDPTILPRDGSIAITVIQFAAGARVDIPIGVINSDTDAMTLASNIRGLSRSGLGSSTSVGSAIDLAGITLGASARSNARQAICLSTDGLRNTGLNVDAAINNAQAQGVDQLDVIVIEDMSLVTFYEARVFGGGPGVAFVADFDEFVTAVSLKIGEIISPVECAAEINSPADNAVISDASVEVKATVTPTEGIPPYTTSCEINGLPGVQSGNSFTAIVPLVFGPNDIIAICTVIDSLGEDFVCQDSIRVTHPVDTLECTVTIDSPADNTTTTQADVVVKGTLTPSGGAPPLAATCEINSVPAVLSGDIFMATVPLATGSNAIVATCAVTDRLQQETVCVDSIQVTREDKPIVCDLKIIAPMDNDKSCGDSVKVTARGYFAGGIAPLTVDCNINGIPAILAADSTISAMVALVDGLNLIEAVCAGTDAQGSQKTCADTVEVSRDGVKPYCTFELDSDGVKGTFFDDDSGIRDIRPVEIRNGILTVEPFAKGAKKVDFRIDFVNPNKHMFFSIDVRDMCKNRFNCDPVFLTLSPSSPTRQTSFSFPSVDRYFQLDNRGLSEVKIQLNGHRFTLSTDAAAVAGAPNTFLMPRQGRIAFDMRSYLREDANEAVLSFEGPSGSSAQIMIADEVDDVGFVLELAEIPREFGLAQNYPNPFNPSTSIRFDIPDRMVDGVDVKLTVYNVLGEVVRVLVDGRRAQGQHTVEWDGRGKNLQPVSSGIYIYQLVAGEARQTRRMLFLK